MLSEAQRAILVNLSECDSAIGLNWQAAEALRRKGYVERETMHITKRVWATWKYGEVDQMTPGDVWVRHEWWITPAGRKALEED